MCFMTPFWSGWESPIGEPSIVLFAVQSEPIPFFFFFAGKFGFFGPFRGFDDLTFVTGIFLLVGGGGRVFFFFFFFFSFFLLVRLFGPLRSVDDPTLVSRILPFVGWSEMICFLFRLLRVYCHRGVIILYIAQ